jgi:hypothetical protein
MVYGDTMAYTNRFVLCILVDGVPQKELANGEVHIPFGSIYSIRVRNRHKRNAAVQLFIDGENVSGEGFKVPANDKIDIHRYADKNVTFKFVDLESPEAVEFGKNGPNPDKVKGVVEARFFLEKEKLPKVEHIHHYHHYPVPEPYPHWPIRPYIMPWAGNTKSNTVEYGHESLVQNCKVTKSRVLREGATVEGHASNQKFNKVHMDLETDYVSVKVFLKGYQPDSHVVQEILQTPKDLKVFCENCGKPIENQSANFCGNCGNRLSK